MVEQRDYRSGFPAHLPGSFEGNRSVGTNVREVYSESFGALRVGNSYPFLEVANRLNYLGVDSPVNPEGIMILRYFEVVSSTDCEEVSRHYLFSGECNGKSNSVPKDILFLGSREIATRRKR